MPLPPNILALYLKFCQLVRARKWAQAYAISDSLEIEWERHACR